MNLQSEVQQKHRLQEDLEDLFGAASPALGQLAGVIHGGLWYRDLNSADEQFTCPVFWSVLGIDPAQRQKTVRDWLEVVQPEDRGPVQDRLRQLEPDTTAPTQIDIRYRHADGSTVWTRNRCLVLRTPRDELRLLCVQTDVTAAALQVAELESANRGLNAMLETASNGMLGLSRSGAVLMANPPARHLLGKKSDDLPFAWPEGVAFQDPNDLSPVKGNANPITRALAGETLEKELHGMTRPGAADHRYVRISSSPSVDPDSEVAVVLVLDDVTGEELGRQHGIRADRLDALGQLTGGIAHDFNNLLTTTQYSIQLANDTDRVSERKAYLNAALQSVSRATLLTQRLLTFARMQPASPKPTNLSDLMAEFMAMARPAIEDGIEIVPTLRDMRLHVICDPSQLDTALLNLLLNGRDAIMAVRTTGQISITVSRVSGIPEGWKSVPSPARAGVRPRPEKVPEWDETGDHALIEVSDDGAGMNPEVLRRAVDPFFTTKQDRRGTGLGLSMVYGFARQSGGEMRLESTPGAGTTVSLLLPVVEHDERAPAVPVHGDAEIGKGKRILLVEDEISLLQMMAKAISSMGFDVVEATSGTGAMDLLRGGLKIDLLFTDVVMPGRIGGFELARQVREMHPDMPVLYMSGYTGFNPDEMGAVVAPLLPKPCPPAEIARMIAQALRSKSANAGD